MTATEEPTNEYRAQLTKAQERIRELEHQVADLTEQRDAARTLVEAHRAAFVAPEDLSRLDALVGRPLELREALRAMREGKA